jgi:hypothetical protein
MNKTAMKAPREVIDSVRKRLADDGIPAIEHADVFQVKEDDEIHLSRIMEEEAIRYNLKDPRRLAAALSLLGGTIKNERISEVLVNMCHILIDRGALDVLSDALENHVVSERYSPVILAATISVAHLVPARELLLNRVRNAMGINPFQ